MVVNKVYYKQVACVGGRYFSIYSPTTEYTIGQELHQEALPNHSGGFYVYSRLEDAVIAKLPRKGLYASPRRVLEVLAWGKSIKYPNGKTAFSSVMPLRDIGMPKGYLTVSKTAALPKKAKPLWAKQETQRLYKEVLELEAMAKQMGIRI